MELLIVISIIGLLSSIIFASLTNARQKAFDAKIERVLIEMRSQSELYTGTGNSFAAGACTSQVNTLFETSNNGLGNLLNNLILSNSRCASAAGLPSAGAGWAVAAQTQKTNNGGPGAWCTDSNHVSRSKNSAGVPYSSTLSTVITAGTTYCQ